jgi:UDP-N-acetylglucosamine diphosphorylase / glucose-1-phosphate thymidylyltransferase / UDP-N-acetylgalactosamine diphosphorylase / glucosamine-1-phosphate N-acetyltransferase / galactosamine-1-phosphate N-acetyltransferase
MEAIPVTFDLERVPTAWRALFDDALPWAVLARLDDFLRSLVGDVAGDVHPTAVLEGPVRVDVGASIGPHAYVQGPAWFMTGSSVGHGAYVRGGVLLASGAKVGHATEVKRSVFLRGAKAPHFNYVGDSVLGHDVNLGAGVKVANLKAFGGTISMGETSTGLRKLGALVGDGASIGCNAVLAPGTVVGAGTVVYHGALLRGLVPAHSVVKVRPTLETTERHG